MIVVDASVAAKWFLPEAGEAAARRLLAGNERMVAPSLIRLEVTGAVVRRFREGHLHEDKARAVCAQWEQTLADGTIHLVPNHELFNEAVECAFAVKHQVPDCLYIVLGKRLGASIITADPPFHKRGRQFYESISLLEGCNPN